MESGGGVFCWNWWMAQISFAWDKISIGDYAVISQAHICVVDA